MSTMLDFEVREGLLGDVKSIADIHNRSVKDIFEEAFADVTFPMMTLVKRQAYWREAIQYAEPQVFVAVDKHDEVLGFIGGDRSRDEKTPPTLGEIFSVYVDKKHRGNGLGIALIKRIKQWLQEEGCTQISIWVTENGAAQGFLESNGFSVENGLSKDVQVSGKSIKEVRLKITLI